MTREDKCAFDCRFTIVRFQMKYQYLLNFTQRLGHMLVTVDASDKKRTRKTYIDADLEDHFSFLATCFVRS